MKATTTQLVKINLEFTVTIHADVERNSAEYLVDRREIESQIEKQFFAQVKPDFDSLSGDRCGGATLVGVPNCYFQA